MVIEKEVIKEVEVEKVVEVEKEVIKEVEVEKVVEVVKEVEAKPGDGAGAVASHRRHRGHYGAIGLRAFVVQRGA